MMEVLKTLLIACVPAIVSGIVSFFLAKSQAKSETNKLKLANEHEIEKLMEQHKVDIDATCWGIGLPESDDNYYLQHKSLLL